MGTCTGGTSREHKCGKTKLKAIDYGHNRAYSTNLKIFTRCQTYLTKQGIISPKLQLLSGHTTEQSLAVYRTLALSDVADEYETAMRTFPIR